MRVSWPRQTVQRSRIRDVVPVCLAKFFVKFLAAALSHSPQFRKKRCHTIRTSDGMLTIPMLTTWPSKDAQRGRRVRLQPMSTDSHKVEHPRVGFPFSLTPRDWYSALAHSLTPVLIFDTGPTQLMCAVARGPIQNPPYLHVGTAVNSGHPGTKMHAELRPKRHHLRLPLFMLLVCHFCSSHKRDPNVRHDTSAFQDNSKAATTRTDNSITLLIHTLV